MISGIKFLLLVCLFLLAEAVDKCPPEQPLPCKCITTHNGDEEYLTIDCQSLNLTEIPTFSQAYHGSVRVIDKLQLNANKLKTLPDNAFKNLKIKSIDLSSNLLETVSSEAFIGLDNVLQILILSENEGILNKSSLPWGFFKHLPTLKVLNLDNCFWQNPVKVSANAFSGLSLLEKLVLSRNRFPSIDAAAFNDIADTLKELDFYGCNLNGYPEAVKICTNLQTLNFDANKITYIPVGTFDNFDKLTYLELSRNGMTNGSLEKDSFRGLISLQRLGFYNQKLANVPSWTFKPLSKLKILDLSYNSIEVIGVNDFDDLPSLVQLVLSHNPLKWNDNMFTSISNKVNYLLLRSFGLEKVPLGPIQKIKTLETLDMASNAFTQIPDDAFKGTSLKTIFLMWMSISNVSVRAFRDLKPPIFLKLDQNKVSNLTFLQTGIINNINLEGNPVFCDCKLYHALINFDIQVQAGICASPTQFKDLRIDTDFKVKASTVCGNHYLPPILIATGGVVLLLLFATVIFYVIYKKKKSGGTFEKM